MSRVSIISHASARAEERGVSESEIKQTLLGGTEIKAKAGRKAKEKIFSYKGNGWDANMSRKRSR